MWLFTLTWFCVAVYPDLVLCGWLPRHGFVWLFTLTWFCVAGDPNLVLCGWGPNLNLCGWGPWLGFMWMFTLIWSCVDRYNDLVLRDCYPNLVLRGSDPDLDLLGWLQWLGFAWMVTLAWFCPAVSLTCFEWPVTLTWFCVDGCGNPDGFVWQEFLPFQFLASRGIIQDEFVGQSFSGTGCRAATSAGCILRCLQSKHYSGSDHLYTVKIRF